MIVPISRLIKKGQRKSQLIIAFIGSVIGLLMLVGSIQLYLDYNSVMFGGEDLLKDGFLVDKKITGVNAIPGLTAKFTESDIEELEASEFVEDLAPVLSTRFKIGFRFDQLKETSNFLFHYFAQAIPTRFLQTKEGTFDWKEGEQVIPIIVPTQFLSAFNNFAPTQGVPQISEAFLDNFPLEIIIEGNGKKDVYKGVIVGMTGKMSTTVLVPYEFLKWANGVYGDPNEKEEIQSLFILSNSKYHHDFVNLMEANNYSVNESKLKASEEKSKVNIILSVLLAIGTVILIQSALNFILYSQLSIFRNEYEIGVLTNIGYDYKTIGRTYIKHFTTIFIAISITAFVLANLGKLYLNYEMQSRNIPLEGTLDPYTYLIGVGFLLVYMVVNGYSILKSIREIASRN